MFDAKLVNYPSGPQLRLYSKVYTEAEQPDPDAAFLRQQDQKEHHSSLLQDLAAEELVEPWTGEKVRTFEQIERSMAVSAARTVNQVYYLARSNRWDWFVTLTFDPEKVDRYNFDACVKKLSKWLNHCRRTCPNMRYLVVPEQHKDGAYHFHGLFADCAGLGFADSGRKTKDHQVIYNIGAYKLGWTTATRVWAQDRVTKYICKYINKDLCTVTFGRKRYWASRNLDRAEIKSLCLTPAEREELLHLLGDKITWCKIVDAPTVSTGYFELSCPVEIDVDRSDPYCGRVVVTLKEVE